MKISPSKSKRKSSALKLWVLTQVRPCPNPKAFAKRIFGMCPKVLTSIVKTDLNPISLTIPYLESQSQTIASKLINKCP